MWEIPYFLVVLEILCELLNIDISIEALVQVHSILLQLSDLVSFLHLQKYKFTYD